MNFNEKRDFLFKKAIEFNDENEIKSDFIHGFDGLIQDIIIGMLEGEDSFFGNFMLKVRRKIRVDITWPIGTIPSFEGYEMSFNPILFLQYSRNEMGALIKHEIYHIMYNHFKREKELKEKYNKLAVALALDISINQFIKYMPGESKRLDGVALEWDVELKDNRSVEEYASILHNKMMKESKKDKKKSSSSKVEREIDVERSHDIWEEVNLSEDTLKDIAKKTSISSVKGNVPKDILEIIKAFNEKSQISWQQLLKGLLPTVKSGYRKTITRRDRRQPERLDIRGRLSDNNPELVVAIDISASMSDDDIKKIMIEILAITANKTNKITVIECDNEIRSVYNLKSPKDIKERSKKSGATAFTPVFKYIKDNNLRNRVLIYFTDGVGEKELGVERINNKTIWVLTGEDELSLREPFGEIRHINKNRVKGEGKGTALEMVREVIHDWAR
ncbi:MAG: vWA domain-containing protein [Clostridium sp.]